MTFAITTKNSAILYNQIGSDGKTAQKQQKVFAN